MVNILGLVLFIFNYFASRLFCWRASLALPLSIGFKAGVYVLLFAYNFISKEIDLEQQYPNDVAPSSSLRWYLK